MGVRNPRTPVATPGICTKPIRTFPRCQSPPSEFKNKTTTICNVSNSCHVCCLVTATVCRTESITRPCHVSNCLSCFPVMPRDEALLAETRLFITGDASISFYRDPILKRLASVFSYSVQLSLAIPPCVGAMNTNEREAEADTPYDAITRFLRSYGLSSSIAEGRGLNQQRSALSSEPL